MVWIKRVETYQGNSAISLNERERLAYHLIILARIISYPVTTVYENYEWNPARSVYGRLTGATQYREFATVIPFQGAQSPYFVKETMLMHYPAVVVYDEELQLMRIQTLTVLLTNAILQEVAEELPPAIDEGISSYIVFLLWLITRQVEEAPDLQDSQFAVRPHNPNVWTIATHPEAIVEWTVLSYLSDSAVATTESEEGGGGGGGGGGTGEGNPDGEFPGRPPLEAPPGTDLEDPPAGANPALFTAEVPPAGPPPPPEIPPGEANTVLTGTVIRENRPQPNSFEFSIGIPFETPITIEFEPIGIFQTSIRAFVKGPGGEELGIVDSQCAEAPLRLEDLVLTLADGTEIPLGSRVGECGD